MELCYSEIVISTPADTSFFRSLSLDLIPIVSELFRQVRKFLKSQMHEGIYEMLEYDSVLDLVDPRGEIAFVFSHPLAWSDRPNFHERSHYKFGRVCLVFEYCSAIIAGVGHHDSMRSFHLKIYALKLVAIFGKF